MYFLRNPLTSIITKRKWALRLANQYPIVGKEKKKTVFKNHKSPLQTPNLIDHPSNTVKCRRTKVRYPKELK